MHDSSNTLNKMYYIRTLVFKNLCQVLFQTQMAYQFLEILFILLEKNEQIVNFTFFHGSPGD